MPQIENWEKEDPVHGRVVDQWEGFYDRLHVVVLDDEGGYQVRRVVGDIDLMDAMDIVDSSKSIKRNDGGVSDRFSSQNEASEVAVKWMKNHGFGVDEDEVADFAKDSPLSDKGLALITLEGYFESHIPFLIDGDGHENGSPYRLTVDWVSEEVFDESVEERDYEIAVRLDHYVSQGLIESMYADGTPIDSVEDYRDVEDRITVMEDAVRPM